jgi:protein-tyrosine-phosphatase
LQGLYCAAQQAQKQAEEVAAGLLKLCLRRASWMEYMTPGEQQRLCELCPVANEYQRHGHKTVVTRHAWLGEDPAAKSKWHAEYERLHLAYNEYMRLYSKATRGK